MSILKIYSKHWYKHFLNQISSFGDYLLYANKLTNFAFYNISKECGYSDLICLCYLPCLKTLLLLKICYTVNEKPLANIASYFSRRRNKIMRFAPKK